MKKATLHENVQQKDDKDRANNKNRRLKTGEDFLQSAATSP
jgi:hypothetical protein